MTITTIPAYDSDRSVATRSLLTSAEASLGSLKCRFCEATVKHAVVDLGLQPLCQNRVTLEALNNFERCYPLRAYVCSECWLVQVDAHVTSEDIFSDYTYASSYSETILAHSRDYVDVVCRRWHLGPSTRVVEIGSNDGYLLQYFQDRQIACLGVEPARRIAAVAQQRGIETRVEYFGRSVAESMVAEGIRADLLVANNVAAHVPNINDFFAGMKTILADQGVITIEVSHLVKIFENNLFDTIYQEHFFYYSLHTLDRILARHGLRVFDVEELTAQGGSLRIYARHEEDASKAVSQAVTQLIDEEKSKGYQSLEAYESFSAQVAAYKRQLLSLLIEIKTQGKRIAAYGAPGKGNTLLNYCGIREDFIDFTVDRNPMKQGTFLVGSRIPVHHPEVIHTAKPDYILILPWNLKNEVISQLSGAREWGAKFIVPLPELTVIE